MSTAAAASFELVAEYGAEQDDLAPVFDAIPADPDDTLAGAGDIANLTLSTEPANVRADLDRAHGR